MKRVLLLVFGAAMAGATLRAAEIATPATPAPPPAAAPQRSESDLEKLAAPIALYPDPLIAIILPAAVYPVEIVQAARFVRDTNNIPKLKSQPWDDNVKAVAEFPAVIQKMSDDLAWTVDLGQAFLDQQTDLMNAIQELRKKAQTVGTLGTTPQQIVVVTNAVVERTVEQQIVYVTNTIVEIQPADPQVIYVPSYNPEIIYYPPPPVYFGPPPIVTFAAGVAVGAIIANNCNWHYGGIYVGGGGGFVVWGGGGGHPPYYRPPPGYRPPPYHPPPGYRPPPPGTRPPGYPPPRPLATPATRPATSGGATPAPTTGQRWEPDSSRLTKSGTTTSRATSEARGWSSGATRATTTPANSPPNRPTTTPIAPRPTQSPPPTSRPTTPTATPNFTRPTPAPSGSSFSRPSPPAGSRDSAFGGVSSGQAARDSSSRGAVSRGGGGGGSGAARPSGHGR